MFFDTTIYIVRYTCIEASIMTLDDIDKPRHMYIMRNHPELVEW